MIEDGEKRDMLLRFRGRFRGSEKKPHLLKYISIYKLLTDKTCSGLLDIITAMDGMLSTLAIKKKDEPDYDYELVKGISIKSTPVGKHEIYRYIQNVEY